MNININSAGKKSSQVLVVPRSVSYAAGLLQVILVQLASASLVRTASPPRCFAFDCWWINNRLLLGVPVGFPQ